MKNLLLKTKNDQMFLLGWGLLLFYYLLIHSSEISIDYSLGIIKIIVFIVVEILWLFVIFQQQYKLNPFLIILIGSIVIGGMIISTSEIQVPLLTLTFLISAKSVKIKNFIAYDFKVRLLIFLSLFLLSMSGVIDNYSTIINGTLKYSFGWKHPNTCASTITLLILEWMYLKWDYFKFKDIVLVLGAVTFMGCFCAARTSMIALFIICIYVVIMKSNLKFSRIIKKTSSIIAIWTHAIIALLSWIILYLYQHGSSVGIILDSVLTHRLYYANFYLSEYGVSLFGQSISIIGTRTAALSGNSYMVLDMSYIYILVQSGLLYSLLFFLLQALLIYYLIKNKQYKELLLVLFFAIAGFTSTVMLIFYRNFTLFFIWEAWEINRKNKKILEAGEQKF